jgi:histidine triad (HIT) family protein
MPSIFTKIINGEIPCYKIAEDENYIAFLDVFPLKKGHTLVVPKKEIDYMFDLDSETYQGLMLFTKKIAEAIRVTYPCNRIGMAVIGLEVPHAHIHLVPINTMNDMNFANDKLTYSKEEFIECAENIKRNL